MNDRLAAVLLLALASLPALAQTAPGLPGAAPPPFAEVFADATLRLDFTFTVDQKTEIVSLDRLRVQGPWAGPRTGLHQPFDYGRYAISLYDLATNRLLYAQGFDGLFGEYRTTTPAQQGEKRAYRRGLCVPLPKASVRVVLASRDRANLLQPVFVRTVDPQAPEVFRLPPPADVAVTAVQQSGAPADKVDLAFVAEGYTADDRAAFAEDVEKMLAALWACEPYASLRDRFNVYAVFRASQERGVSEPRQGRFRRTAVGASFNALGLDRYLLTEDDEALRTIASAAPHDTLVLLVNSERYGGGGIYQDYAASTADHALSRKVFLHEFGHSFAGLGDEYFTSEVAYNDFYPAGQEPLEPNLTALLVAGRPKWAGLVSAGLELPTPWEQQERDRLTQAMQELAAERQQAVAKAKQEGKGEAELKALADGFQPRLEELAKAQKARAERLAPLRGKVGAFEGAGYAAKGLYRPSLECLMFSNAEGGFCPVCQDAILRMVLHVCGGR
ncbi:MAG: peptidase M64 [Planctomycetes bacterium]|nr:peptidase M64 [Planctomycetota bacterium]